MNKARISEEARAAAAWELQPHASGHTMPEQLLQGEFLDPAEQSARLQARIARTCTHAFGQVPHYRTQAAQPGFGNNGFVTPQSWLQLPLLRKQDLVSQADALRADSLLENQQIQGVSKTSGTTGQPVAVLHTDSSKSMFAWLKQRELRWFRFDPRGKHLSIRPGEELARTADDQKWPDGQLLELPGWPYLHNLFRTGSAWGFSSTNPVADQAAILEQVQPDYLLMEPATLENLALQHLSRETRRKLRAVQSISQTLTADMAQSIGSSLGAPIFQNYGLNEIGLVASMCPEGQRYHVHQEHAFVELIKESGEPAMPGERGKLVVTALRNSAMPLLRYDTEDWAEMADTDCPCGRSLPSFVNIEGRYRRLAQLPPGSYQRFKAIQAAVNQFARQRPSSVQQYQLCQHKDGSFTLIVDCSNEFFERLRALAGEAFASAWQTGEQPHFSIEQGRNFSGLEKRKFQIFYSELMPDN